MYAKLPDDRLELFQWDNGVSMEVSSDVERIDFQFRSTGGIVYGVFREDDKVSIPDILLQSAGVVDALVMIKNSSGSVTAERMEITVIERPMPPGYMVTKNGSIVTTEELGDLIAGMDILPKSGGRMSGDIDMDGYLVSNLSDAEDSGDAVSKHYGDFAYLQRSGGTMTGRITGLLPPIGGTEPVRKAELDELSKEYEQFKEDTGKSFADIGASRKLIHNTVVAEDSFAADTTYGDFGFRAAIPIAGVTADWIPDVTFPVQDKVRYAPVAQTYDGGVYIYADGKPSGGVTIPTILLWRGDGV